MKQTVVLTHETNVNGWFRTVFHEFHESKLPFVSRIGFIRFKLSIFLLMYPWSMSLQCTQSPPRTISAELRNCAEVTGPNALRSPGPVSRCRSILLLPLPPSLPPSSIPCGSLFQGQAERCETMCDVGMMYDVRCVPDAPHSISVYCDT